MQSRSLIILGMVLIFHGCSSTSVPMEIHNDTTKKISNLEEEGDVLEREGKKKLDDLIGTLNQPIN